MTKTTIKYETKAATKIEWLCPKCGADANEHGRGTCLVGDVCDGFTCLCETNVDAASPDHGESLANVCPLAYCNHCDWEGVFPPMPKKMPPWAKKALAAGWTPPDGWMP